MSKQTLSRKEQVSTKRNATVFAALGDATRLQLLSRLGSSGPQSIKQLATELPVTRQAVTKHLRVLENANFVVQSIHGRERRFTVRKQGITEAQAALQAIEQQWGDALARLKQFVEDKT